MYSQEGISIRVRRALDENEKRNKDNDECIISQETETIVAAAPV
jgi:hypothetical protein